MQTWAWHIEGHYILDQASDVQDEMIAELVPMQSSTVQDFLGYSSIPGKRTPRRTDRTICIGPKGSGKTLLLSLKSKLLHDKYTSNEDGNTVFFPKDDLVERFIQSHEIREYAYANQKFWKKADNWCDAWKFTIAVIIFELSGSVEHLSKDQRESYRKYFDPIETYDAQGKVRTRQTSISYLRQVVFLTNSPHKNDFRRFIERIVEPYLVADQNTTYNLFFDAPDEAFAGADEDDHFHDKNRKSLASTHKEGQQDTNGHVMDVNGQAEDNDPNFWLELQMGLLLAARRVKQYSRLIRVHATIKTEVYGLEARSELFQQALDLALKLNYTYEQLRDIFEKNAKKSSSSGSIADGANDNEISRFVGLSTISHHTVIDENGQPRSEDIFDYIVRHTLYRPRNLMEIGGAIADHKIDHTISEESIRDIVTTQSSALFKYHCEQSRSWDERYLNVLDYVYSNVITKTALEYAKNKFTDWAAKEKVFSVESKCPFQYLYLNGMVGVIGFNGKQQFRTHWTDTVNASHPIADSDYYFLHPMLFSYIIKERNHREFAFRQSLKTISGHGLDYHPEPTITVRQHARYRCQILLNGAHELGLNDHTAPKNLLIAILYVAMRLKTTTLDIEDIINTVPKMEEETYLKKNNNVISALDSLVSGKATDTVTINNSTRPLLGHRLVRRNSKLNQVMLVGINADCIQFVQNNKM